MPGDGQGLRERFDSELFAFGVDQPDLPGADALVYPVLVQISCSGYALFSLLWPLIGSVAGRRRGKIDRGGLSSPVVVCDDNMTVSGPVTHTKGRSKRCTAAPEDGKV